MRVFFLLVVSSFFQLAANTSDSFYQDCAKLYVESKVAGGSRNDLVKEIKILEECYFDLSFSSVRAKKVLENLDCLCASMELRARGDNEDDFDYTDSIMGGAEILGGGLIMILPGVAPSVVGGGLVVDGFSRVWDNVSEKGKENRRRERRKQGKE